MAGLLVLGSKPDPRLPPREAYDDLACANASGASAARCGLARPAYTVISAILTSDRKAPNRLALAALQGLETGSLYFYPRPAKGAGALGRALHRLKTTKMQPSNFRRRLDSLGYRYERFLDPGLDHYLDVVKQLCGQDPEVSASLARKSPSTGVIAVALGLWEERYDRVIVAGFSFEITHAYAENPLIAERGTAESKHADTDIAVLRCLARRFDSLYTTEPVVAEIAGLPLLPEATADQPYSVAST